MEEGRNAFDFDNVNDSSTRYGGLCEATIDEIVGDAFPNPQIRRAYHSDSRNLAPEAIRHRGHKRVQINNLIERVAAIHYIKQKTNLICCTKLKCLSQFDDSNEESRNLLNDIWNVRLWYQGKSSQSERRRFIEDLIVSHFEVKENSSRSAAEQGAYYRTPRLFEMAMCKKTFLLLMDISDSLFQNVMKSLNKRGSGFQQIRKKRHDWNASEKRLYIENWLERLGRLHDPMPHRDYIRLYYSTKTHVYEVYRAERKALPDKTAMPKVSVDYFLKIWDNALGDKIKIKGGSKGDFTQCDTCTTLNRERIRCKDAASREKNLRDTREHDKDFEVERKAFNLRKQAARDHPDEILHLSWDGADQSAYGLPYFRIPDKTSITFTKIKQYVIGVKNYCNELPDYLFHHLPIFERGSNCSIEVLHRMLTKIHKKKGFLPKLLYIQLDNCWRENKNKFLFAFLAELVWRGVFDEVQISFLIKGHTHFCPDQMFSRISVRLCNRDDIYCVEDFLSELMKSQQPDLPVETVDACASIKQHLSLIHI